MVVASSILMLSLAHKFLIYGRGFFHRDCTFVVKVI